MKLIIIAGYTIVLSMIGAGCMSHYTVAATYSGFRWEINTVSGLEIGDTIKAPNPSCMVCTPINVIIKRVN